MGGAITKGAGFVFKGARYVTKGGAKTVGIVDDVAEEATVHYFRAEAIERTGANYGTFLHNTWKKVKRNEEIADGIIEWIPSSGQGRGIAEYTVDRAIRDSEGKVVAFGEKKWLRPDYVNYARHEIRDLKPVPPGVMEQGPDAVRDYLYRNYKDQIGEYIAAYKAAYGIKPTAIWEAYSKEHGMIMALEARL